MTCPCTVIVPDHAPAAKLAAVERLGARIVRVPFERWWQVIVDHGHPDFDGLFIHPFADPAVMAGNGIIGLEIVEDAAHCCPAFFRRESPEFKVQSRNSEVQGSRFKVQSSEPPTGSTGDWLPVGTGTNISCYSFYANKTITSGEGGMACTNNEEYAERMRRIRTTLY